MAELGGLGPALARIVAEGGVAAPGRICQACLAVLPVTRAAVTVMTSADRQEPIWASDDVAGHLDELQFSLGEGPCVEAFTEGRPVLVPDLAELTGHRWPMFADAARQTTVQALFVLPLQAGALVIGVLDLYRDEPGMLRTRRAGGRVAYRRRAAVGPARPTRRAARRTGRRWPWSGPERVAVGVAAEPHRGLSGHGNGHGPADAVPGSGIEQVAGLGIRARPGRSTQVAGDVVARRLRFDEEER